MAAEAAAPPRNIWAAIAQAVWRALEANRRAAPCAKAAEREGARRARELLLAHLAPAQRAELECRQAFTVRGQSGRHYRIGYGVVANVEVLDEHGATEFRLCACPKQVPTWAVMLAQKLMLESREAEFLRVAIRHPANLRVSAELDALGDVLRGIA